MAVIMLSVLFHTGKAVHQHAKPIGQLRLDNTAGFFPQLGADFS